ncbi:MAG: NAD(+)/NADH kinase [Candidatus Thermoplasmatota archaeon]
MSLNFGVYGTLYKDHIEEIKSLKEHPSVDRVYFEETIAEDLEEEGHPLKDILEKDIDFIMSIGGDGTLLRLMQHTDLPALGVNTGTVGFLTNVEISEVDEALKKIENKEYFLDERFKLDVMLNGEKIGECTNEMVVHSDKVAKLREMEVYYGGNMIDKFRADGLIISTPTGSTCYAMSAGGPIVHPDLDLFVVAPLNPFDMATKPQVVPVEEPVRVKLIEEDKPGLIVLDGRKEHHIDRDDDVAVHPSDNRAKLISFKDNFYDKIKEKLVSKSVFR